MSNLVEHAKRELTLAGLFNKDSDYGGMMGDSVMELMEVLIGYLRYLRIVTKTNHIT